MPSAEDYVVIELQGRLGNHLFLFALGFGLARRHDAALTFMAPDVPAEELLLPRIIGDLYREATPAQILRVGGCPETVPPALAGLVKSIALRSSQTSRRLRHRTPPSTVHWTDTGRFRPAVLDYDLPLRVVGHLQSERYFEDYADEVADAIHLPEVAAPDATTGPTVAVSFRRGDYNSLGWALPVDYYDRAMQLVADRLGPVTVVCFGDDQAFVQLMVDRLAAYGDVVNALEIGLDPLAQLALMARCDHHVIANSTFSWWGAWLGERRRLPREVIVVAPEEFVGGDRVPARWHTLPTGVAPF